MTANPINQLCFPSSKQPLGVEELPEKTVQARTWADQVGISTRRICLAKGIPSQKYFGSICFMEQDDDAIVDTTDPAYKTYTIVDRYGPSSGSVIGSLPTAPFRVVPHCSPVWHKCAELRGIPVERHCKDVL